MLDAQASKHCLIKCLMLKHLSNTPCLLLFLNKNKNKKKKHHTPCLAPCLAEIEIQSQFQLKLSNTCLAETEIEIQSQLMLK